MKRDLRIGPGFTLPLDAITTSTGTFGIRGSGKTNTNVVMVEEFLEHGLQVAILDPTDAWWGLKSSKDGRKAGYPIIVLGGRHADLPLGDADGNTIADFVVDTGASVILSLRHFETDAAKRRLVTDFCRRLYFRKGQVDNPSPVMVVIDEASIIVPQVVSGGDAHMVSAVQRLVRQGRSSGIGVNLIDARPATVNKDVLAGVEMLVTHRVTSPKDRKALREYVEQHDPDGRAAKFLDELASLPQGTAWFWSPGWLDVFEKVAVRERRTFDSSRTPKAGEVAIVPTKMAEIDLEAIRAKLGATIERAKAEDPKELKKDIARLQAELVKAQRSAPGPDPAAVQRQVEAAVAAERGRLHREVLNHVAAMRKTLAHANSAAEQIPDLLDGAIARLDVLTESTPAPSSTKVAAVSRASRTAAAERPGNPTAAPVLLRRESTRGTAAATTLTGARAKIVRALAELEAIGVDAPSRKQLSFYCGVSFAGGYGSNTLGAMRTEGLIEYPSDGHVALTDEGRAAAGEFDPPSSLRDLHDRVRQHLSGLSERIFDAVIELGPGGSISREDLGAQINASFAGGYGSNTLGALRTAGIVEYPSNGTVGPSDLLFPPGLN